MDTYTLAIGTCIYRLNPDTDIEPFQRQLTETVQRGGGIIDIPTTGTNRISVLASPGLPIVFQAHSTPDNRSEDTGDEADLDYLNELDWDYL